MNASWGLLWTSFVPRRVLSATLAALALSALFGCGGQSTDPDPRLDAAVDSRRASQHAPASPAAPPFTATAADPVDEEDAASQLFDFGERNFAQYFPSSQATRTFEAWVYRFYPETGAYLGVSGGDVFVTGGPFGSDIFRVGPLTSYITPIVTRPTAIASRDRARVIKGSAIVFTGSRSTDPNGDTLSYSWLLESKPASSSAAFTSPEAVRTELVLDRVGTYNYALTVSDGKLMSKPYRSAVVAGENYDGRWAGTTSQGLPFEFEIVDSRVRAVTVGARFESSCGTTVSVAGAFDAELGIADFTVGSSSLFGTSLTLAQGTFTSLTKASGTFSALMTQPICVDTLNGITWTATRR